MNIVNKFNRDWMKLMKQLSFRWNWFTAAGSHRSWFSFSRGWRIHSCEILTTTAHKHTTLTAMTRYIYSPAAWDADKQTAVMRKAEIHMAPRSSTNAQTLRRRCSAWLRAEWGEAGVSHLYVSHALGPAGDDAWLEEVNHGRWSFFLQRYHTARVETCCSEFHYKHSQKTSTQTQCVCGSHCCSGSLRL